MYDKPVIIFCPFKELNVRERHFDGINANFDFSDSKCILMNSMA